MAQDIQFPAADGAWTWHQGPRAIHRDGKTFTAYVDSKGSTKVASYDHDTEETVERTLNEELLVDDHISPTITIRNEDDRLLLLYARGQSQVWARVSEDPLDISSFQDEFIIEYDNHGNVSYPNTGQLASENDRMYLWTRGSGPVNFDQYYRVSEDGGETWAEEIHFTEFGDDRNYIKQWVDDPKIWLTLHRSNNEGTGNTDFFTVVYYEDGAIYSYDDEHIAEIGADSNDLPITPTDLEPYSIFEGVGTDSDQFRVWDLILPDDEDAPRVISARTHDTDSHSYHFHRYDGTEWQNSTIVEDAGTGNGRDYYSGGLCFDGTDPNTVYYVAEDGQHELYRGETTDNGGTWTHTQLTFNSREANFRPCQVRDATEELRYLWLWGRYDEFTDYDQKVYSMPPVGDVRVVTEDGIQTLSLVDEEPAGEKIPVGTQTGEYWADLSAADTEAVRVVTDDGIKEWSAE